MGDVGRQSHFTENTFAACGSLRSTWRHAIHLALPSKLETLTSNSSTADIQSQLEDKNYLHWNPANDEETTNFVCVKT